MTELPKGEVEGKDCNYAAYIEYMRKLYKLIAEALSSEALNKDGDDRIVYAIMFDKMCLPYYYWKRQNENEELLKKAKD